MRPTTRPHLPFAFASSITLVAGLARADVETLRLADGSVFVGELVEKVPGDHVTIKLATGEIRRVEWGALAPATAAERGGLPLAVAPPVPFPVQATVQPVPPIHVDVTSDRKGALLMKVETNRPYGIERVTAVCYAPCAADVDPTAAYYVTGAYITQSNKFAIPTGPAHLQVRAGNSALGAFGGWTLGFGILSALFGTVDTPVAFVDAAHNGSSGWNGWQYVGVATLSVGAGLILLGIPFLVASATHVSLGDMDVARAKVRWTAGGLVF